MAKILLVEDDKSLREIYGVRLMAEGYTITSAGDGEEALAVAIKERPDLIVSDVMMPKISGFDMLDILRSTTETKDIKVIMMTALSSEDQRARGEALGADRYLVKSQVGIEDVVRTVHDVLGDSLAGPASTGPVFPPAAAPAPVAPAPVATTEAVPQPAPTAIPVFSAPEPQSVPAPVAPAAPEPLAQAPIAAPVEQPQPVYTPAPQPVAPVEAAAPAPYTPPVAYTPELASPVAEPVVAPAPVAPFAVEPPIEAPVQQFDIPAPAPEIAVAPAPQPVFTAPAPAPQPVPAPFPASTLPAPTAPFSSPRPASLGDRVINPLPSAESLNPGTADLAAQMNQELNAQLQQLAPEPAPVAPAPVAPNPPTGPYPPQPGV